MRARSSQLVSHSLRRVRIARSGQVAPPPRSFPTVPGSDEVTKVCGTCHPATTAASVRLTRDGWQMKIGDMVSRGAMATDEELAAILEYLATHFLGEANELVERQHRDAGSARERPRASASRVLGVHRVPRTK